MRSGQDVGAAYVFAVTGASTWAQEAYVKASNTAAANLFGHSVKVSDTGTTLVSQGEKQPKTARK
jgi:type IV secretory pathway TrbL component